VALVWAPLHVVLLQVTVLPVHRILISSLGRRQACVFVSFAPYVGRAQNSNRETYPSRFCQRLLWRLEISFVTFRGP